MYKLLFLLLAAAPLHAETVILTDLDAALAQGKAQSKVVLLDYSAVWCPPCQLLEKEVFRSGALDKYSDRLIVVRLDPDHMPKSKTHERFPVRGYPGYWLIAPDGTPVDKGSGYAGKELFLDFVDRSLARAKAAGTSATDAIAGLKAAGYSVEQGAGAFYIVGDANGTRVVEKDGLAGLLRELPQKNADKAIRKASEDAVRLQR